MIPNYPTLVKDELYSIFEDIWVENTSEKDRILLTIALIHLLMDYPNINYTSNKHNFKINYFILKYYDKIRNFRDKHKI